MYRETNDFQSKESLKTAMGFIRDKRFEQMTREMP
jgi:hypothetical protein